MDILTNLSRASFIPGPGVVFSLGVLVGIAATVYFWYITTQR